MNKLDDIEIVVIGTGIIGIATAYYLSKKYQKKSILLIDSRDPMSYTSAQSGDNYRNWWPTKVMTQFANHSIQLMREIAAESDNILQMKQRGYVLATRNTNIDNLVNTLQTNYNQQSNMVRVHTDSCAQTTGYQQPHNDDWRSNIEGVDLLCNKTLINNTFGHFSAEIENVLHIRKAGEISSQQMGQFMLQQMKSFGCKRLRGKVRSISKNDQYSLEIETPQGTMTQKTQIVVNAAGPYVGEIASMLGVSLPVENIFHQKLAFEDHLAAVPRNQPFSVDIDQTTLGWDLEEQDSLNQDPELCWLTQPIVGGIHCRPEGSGHWIKLGWAYNRSISVADNQKQLIEDPQFSPHFPEIVLRGASRLNPALSPYIDVMPANRIHYGGYYTMTKENWPLIGPMDNSGAYVVGALSGFGSMSACAAGSLCADWICGGELPEYAQAFKLNRYQDPKWIKEMACADVGLL